MPLTIIPGGQLDELAAGDQVSFTDADGNVFHYEVVLLETLSHTAVGKMASGDWDLTLFTCTSGGGSRYAVRCVRKGYPVRVTDAAE